MPYRQVSIGVLIMVLTMLACDQKKAEDCAQGAGVCDEYRRTQQGATTHHSLGDLLISVTGSPYPQAWDYLIATTEASGLNLCGGRLISHAYHWKVWRKDGSIVPREEVTSKSWPLIQLDSLEPQPDQSQVYVIITRDPETSAQSFSISGDRYTITNAADRRLDLRFSTRETDALYYAVVGEQVESLCPALEILE